MNITPRAHQSSSQAGWTCARPPRAQSAAAYGRVRARDAHGPTLRGLTQPECIAYARWRHLEFIGVVRELSEFAGCVIWGGRTVEFNEHATGAGCTASVLAKGGQCLCTPAASSAQ